MPVDYSELSSEPKIRYRYWAFLLRCWHEMLDGGFAWRFTLVQLGDGQVQRGFASLEDVSAFIKQALASPSPGGEPVLPDGV